MSFSQSNRGKYIRCLALSVAFIFGNLVGYASKPKAERIEEDFPFVQDPGYIPGGESFDYEIENENGEKFKIKDLKGNVVIIALFTTWCSNCPSVLQDFDFLVEKLQKTKNVKIIALNIGDESINALKIYYKSRNVQLLDAYRSVSPEIMRGGVVRGVPACLVFDKNGSPVWGYLGAANYNSPKFVNFIKNLAEKKS
ncbi:MAG: TlpA family protein disulfide reductase [Holosporaceae bacterium]|jgi:thiol-disulfide isomerase/thioredoxin|nr:TlpA family protein disulfide reductase [Holosporaceae bacterium]